jgi:hypothetical protein
MYQKGGNYVACVKVDGKILREDADGAVNLPFGAEYGIFLKNLNSVRAVAKVTVDGVEASGHGIIIPANGSVDLERFLKRDGDMSRGNKFKFIERTAGIEEHKGIGAEDGLIRIEYLTEVQPEVRKAVVEHVHHSYPHYPYWPYSYWPGVIYSGLCQSGTNQAQELSYNFQAATGAAQNSLGAMNVSNTSVSGCASINETSFTKSSTPPLPRPTSRRGPSGQSSNMLRSATRSLRPASSAQVRIERSAAVNNVGITVPGAESNQRFTTGEWFNTETASHVIVLQLRGVIGGKPVVAAVTVKTKKKCPTCGTASKSNVQFCGKCGTALNIL